MQISNRICTKTLIKLFNQKIARVSKERLDIAEIQPLIRSENYLINYKKFSRSEKLRARQTMLAYLQEGAEERSTKYSSLTKWGEKAAEQYVRKLNKNKTEIYKSPFLKDVDKTRVRPQFEYMSAEQAKRALYALEKQTEAEGVISPKIYKENYLKAVENEMGRGYLYDYVLNLPEDIIVGAYYDDPATFEIKFIYSQDEKEAQQLFLLEQFQDYANKHMLKTPAPSLSVVEGGRNNVFHI